MYNPFSKGSTKLRLEVQYLMNKIPVSKEILDTIFEETGYKVKPEQLKHCYSKLKNTKTFTALLDDAYMDNLTTEFPEYEKEIQSVAGIPLEYLGNILPRDNCNTTLKPLIDNQYIMNKLLQNN